MPYITRNEKIRNILNYAALILMMVFYAGTWTFPLFYHVTEIYNSLIIFGCLLILFAANIDIIEKIKKKDKFFLVLILAILIAVINLFIISSNKGCILIIADFLMILYLAPEMKITENQFKMLEVFFLIMFISWFVYDRAFSYNSNTGATVTVFTFFGGILLMQKLVSRREIYGFFIVLSFVRVITLVFWHLARGAFLAVFLFIFFYYVLPKDLWKSRPFRIFLILFSTLGSLLFVGSYVMIGASGFNVQLPLFYKNVFSGRERIWYEVWEILRNQLLTGIGSGRELKSFFEYNIHNAMYDILAVHGLPVFILSLILIWDRLSKALKTTDEIDKTRLAALSAVFAIFIESFIDMDLMWADYSPLVLFLLLEIFRGEEPSLRSG